MCTKQKRSINVHTHRRLFMCALKNKIGARAKENSSRVKCAGQKIVLSKNIIKSDDIKERATTQKYTCEHTRTTAAMVVAAKRNKWNNKNRKKFRLINFLCRVRERESARECEQRIYSRGYNASFSHRHLLLAAPEKHRGRIIIMGIWSIGDPSHYTTNTRAYILYIFFLFIIFFFLLAAGVV